MPVELFSMTTSECSASFMSTSWPSGVFAFAPNPSFERLDDTNDGENSPPVTVRMKSGYARDSILITSAPYSARRRPTSTPTAPMPKSMTRTPARGGAGIGGRRRWYARVAEVGEDLLGVLADLRR